MSGAPAGGPVRPSIALVFALIGYFTLAIFGFGMTSLITNTDVIAVRGLGPLPGVIALVLSAAAFSGALWLAVRRPEPSYPSALPAAVCAFVFYLVGVWFGALVAAADLIDATASVGSVATSWFALVILGAALVSAWGAVALVRTHSGPPHWPWEDGSE